MQTYISVNKAEAMYNSLVQEFVDHGHSVTVVASNEGKNPTTLQKEGPAEVLRVRTLPLLNINLVLKAVSNLLLSTQYSVAIKRYLKGLRFDLIVTPTPPITLTNLAARIKKRDNSKIYLILRDIFPQNAVDLGMISKKNPYYFFFRALERKLYRISDAIGCMSEQNINYLVKHNVWLQREKLHRLPNWSTISTTNFNVGDNFYEKYKLKGKFIVLFGGNLGPPQKIENLVEFSRLHRDKKDLVILVIGKGTHKKRLEKLIESERIENIIIFDYMKRAEYENFVAVSHVGFISLNEKFTIPNIPSRVLSYYNFRKPIFAIVDKSTDFGELLTNDQSGFCCHYSDYEKYKELFDRLYYNPALRNRMGENGYKALLTEYNPRVTYSKVAAALSFS